MIILKPNSFNKILRLIFLSFITLIFIINFISVLSYNFPSTSQVSYVIFLSLLCWGSIIIFYSFSNINGLSLHLIPEGTPIFLTWFLFLIEIVRNLIRPLTLTVRLVANILAGHLLIILLSKLALWRILPILGYTILNLVEILVSMIQSYIFVTIISLYYSELA